MKITNVKKITCHIVDTDGEEYSRYTRWGADCWTVEMGESDEQHYDSEEIERKFQEFMTTKDHE